MKTQNLLLSILVALFFCSCQKQYESIRLIPKGFQGAIAIIYKVDNGEVGSDEKGAVVYKIPTNGILKVKREAFYGNQEHEFYYVDSLGNREPIPYIKEWDLIDKKSNQVVCFNETINSSELIIDGKKELYKYTVFLVGGINKSDSLFKFQDSFLDKLR